MSLWGTPGERLPVKTSPDISIWVARGLQFLFCCHRGRGQPIELPKRRRGREAEGGGLLKGDRPSHASPSILSALDYWAFPRCPQKPPQNP